MSMLLANWFWFYLKLVKNKKEGFARKTVFSKKAQKSVIRHIQGDESIDSLLDFLEERKSNWERVKKKKRHNSSFTSKFVSVLLSLRFISGEERSDLWESTRVLNKS